MRERGATHHAILDRQGFQGVYTHLVSVTLVYDELAPGLGRHAQQPLATRKHDSIRCEPVNVIRAALVVSGASPVGKVRSPVDAPARSCHQPLDLDRLSSAEHGFYVVATISHSIAY